MIWIFEWYGVGFVVSPRFKDRVQGFCQFSNRVALLKVKCTGGAFAHGTALAPHNLRQQCEKLEFYENLAQSLARTSVNGPKFIFGDFNARIGEQRPGEEGLLGPFCFGAAAQHKVELPNRDLLMEFCSSHSLGIANTFFDAPLDQKATYHEPSVPPRAPICNGKFSMLDLLLCPSQHFHSILDIRSNRMATLASHHFPVTAALCVNMSCVELVPTHRRAKYDWFALHTPDVRQAVCDSISSGISAVSVTEPNQFWKSFCESVESAVKQHVPVQKHRANKPWIGTATLDLLDQRRAARETNNWALERQLRLKIKKSAKSDRARWLEDLVASGDWGAIKKLRKGKAVKQGRLKNAGGELAFSEDRASTLA